MVTREKIIEIIDIHPFKVLNIYPFGSRVYGNFSDLSDWDFIVIAKTSSPEIEIKFENFNIHILSEDRFKEGLRNHNIRNIECVMLPSDKILQERIKFDFHLDLSKLRHSVSHISSNSYVKCKKKLSQGDYHVGVKSFWHSIRIIMFGIQLSKYGKIVDWSCCNNLWGEINSKKWSFEELDSKFRSYKNTLLSEFRILATK